MTITSKKRILILSYSFSGQTSCLTRRIKIGLENNGHRVIKEKIEPVVHLKFPTGSIAACLMMMFITLFRRRTPICPLSEQVNKHFDLIILAGPTWSYNPSGPILYLIDHYGRKLFGNQTVLPLISCRGYWRMHQWGLKALLQRYGAHIPNSLIFSHPCREPWRTIGVFMKIAGKAPEHSAFLRGHYKKFGHSQAQQDEAERLGELIGKALQRGEDLSTLRLHTPITLP